jgi:hypothetical protein
MRLPLNVISFRKFEKGYFMDVACDAENALAALPGNRLLAPDYPVREYVLTRNRVARTLLRHAPGWSPDLFMGCGGHRFFFLMWCDRRVFPLMRNASIKKSAYLFDTWEPDWAWMESEMAGWRNIGAVYFSSSQAARHFKPRLPYAVRWCPQATTVPQAPRVQSSGQRVVLNIGRPNKTLSAFFKSFCAEQGMTYLSQDTVEGILFASRRDFLDTLLRSAIVVVHPRNIDSPEMTGAVSMLTSRYFEAYHSGGIVCGFKPQSGEFEQVLADYPFIEFTDAQRFKAQLLAALDQPEPWRQACERAQREHTWAQRAQLISADGDYLGSCTSEALAAIPA